MAKNNKDKEKKTALKTEPINIWSDPRKNLDNLKNASSGNKSAKTSSTSSKGSSSKGSSVSQSTKKSSNNKNTAKTGSTKRNSPLYLGQGKDTEIKTVNIWEDSLKKKKEREREESAVRRTYGETVPNSAIALGRGPVKSESHGPSRTPVPTGTVSSFGQVLFGGNAAENVMRAGAIQRAQNARKSPYSNMSYREMTDDIHNTYGGELRRGNIDQLSYYTERSKYDRERIEKANIKELEELLSEKETEYNNVFALSANPEERRTTKDGESYRSVALDREKELKILIDEIKSRISSGKENKRIDDEYDNNLIKFGKIALGSGGNGEYVPTGKVMPTDYDIANQFAMGRRGDNETLQKLNDSLYSPKEHLSFMTDGELKLLNDLQAADPEKAQEFIDGMEGTLNRRLAEKQAREAYEYGQEHPYLAGAKSVVQNVTTGLPAAVDNIAEGFKVGDVDTYDSTSRILRESQMLRQGGNKYFVNKYGEKDGKWRSFAYNTGLSMVENLANIALFKGAGGAASKLIAVNMASNAAANSMISIADRGGNDLQILAGGVASGAAEYLFEKFSVERLFDIKSARNVREFVKTVFIQSGIEGSEEVFTEAANIISDAVIMQNNSESNTRLREYVMQGMSADEAKAQVFRDNVKQIAEAAASGMLSGGVMGGGAAAIQSASRSNYMNSIGESLINDKERLDRVITLGLESGNADAKYTAEILSEGMTIDSKQAGKLLESVVGESISKDGGIVNIINNIYALEGRGSGYIGSKESIDTAKAVMHMAQGQITDVDRALIGRSSGAVTLLSAIEGNDKAWGSVKSAAGRDLRGDSSAALGMTNKDAAQRRNAEFGVRSGVSQMQNAEFGVQNGTPRPSASGGVKYKYTGTTKDGIKKYVTDFPEDMDYKAREKVFKERIATVFNLGAVKLNTDTKKIQVMGDKFTAQKNLYGDDSSPNEINAKINSLYDIAEILSDSKFTGKGIEPSYADPNIKPENAAHKDVKYWYYFENTISMDGKIYDVVFNIRDKGKEQYQYLVKFIEKNKKTTRISHTAKMASGVNIDELSPTDRVSQKEESVNSYSMRDGTIYSQGKKVSITGDEKVVDNIVQNEESREFRKKSPKEYKVIVKMAKDLGMPVKFVDGLTDSDEKVLDGIITNKGIFINTQSNNPTRFAVTHEFSHRMKQAAPKQWEKYQNYVIDRLKNTPTESEGVSEYDVRYEKKKGHYKAYEIDEEIACNYIGSDLIDNVDELQALINHDKGLAQTVRRIWNWVCDRLGLSDAKDKAARMWMRAYNKSAKNVEKGKVGGYSREGKKSFAGVRAKTSNVDALNRAQKMEREGKTAEEIWQKTGWGRGLDGKWRFEINDFESYLTEKPNLELHRSKEGDYYAGKLEDIFNHKKLFESYPPLKETKIIIQEKEPGVYATTFANRNEIVLSKTLFERTTDEYKDLLNNRQKYIDEIERTPEYKKYDSIYKMEDGEISPEEWLRLEAESRKNFFETDLGKRYYSLRWGKDNVRKYELGWSDKAKEVLLHEIQHLIQYEEGFAKGSNPSYWKGENNTNRDASDLYKNTAGEIEARDVQERRDMTEEERRNTYPESFRMNDNVVFADTEVNYDIVTLDNGKTYVEATRQIITGNNISQWRKSITEFFNNALKNGDIKIAATDGTILTITKDTAKKARDNYKIENGKIVKMSDGEFLVKLHAESHIDELAEIAKKTGHRKDGKNHSFAKNGFDYKTVYFKDFDNSYYEITLSVGLSNGISTVYNVGKIKTDNLPTGKIISRKVGQSPMANLSVDTTVSQNTPVVNTHSMQEGEIYSQGKAVSIPEKGRVARNIVLNEESARMRKENPKAYRNIETMARDLRMRVMFVKGLYAENYNPSVGGADSSLYTREPLDGVITSQGIFINSEAKNPSRFAATHEFSHGIKQKAPGAWNNYQQYVIGKLKIDGRYYTEYKKKAAAYNNSDENFINEEIAADYIGELFANETELADFIRDNKSDAFSVRNMWYTVLDKLGLLDEKKKAQRMWMSAYKAAMKNKDGEFKGSKASQMRSAESGVRNVVDLSANNELTNKIGNLRGSEKYKVIRDFILEELKDYQIVFNDGITAIVDKSDALHIANKSANKKTSYIAKIKEVIEKAKLYAIARNVEHKKFNEFRYYQTAVRFGEDVYDIYLNVGKSKNGDGYHLYDITKKIGGIAKQNNALERVNQDLRSEIDSPTSTTVPQNPPGVNRKSISGTRMSDIEGETTPQSTEPTAPLTQGSHSQVTEPKAVSAEEESTPKGRIKPGEEPRRDVVVPKSVQKGTKVRQFARTAAEAETLTDETAEGVLENVEQGKFSYTPLSDKKAMNYAYSAIDTMGMEWAEKEVNGAIAGHSLNKNTVALAEVLMQRYSEEGQQEKAQQLIIDFAAEGTRMGQSIQAISMLKKLDKNYEIAYIDKIVENLKEDIIQKNGKKLFGKKYFTDIEVSEELKAKLREAKTESERETVREQIYTELAEQLPVTWIDRWNAWRYFAMLGNARTHVRNVLGNAFFMPMIGTKNAAATLVETIGSAVSGGKMERSKTFIVPKRYRDFAKADALAMRKELQGGGKHNPSDSIKDKQKLFPKGLEWMRVKVGDALEYEDWIFLKKHYATALGNYLAANKIDLENMDEKMLDRARYKALQEAQRNTYRDVSAFANTLSKLSKANAPAALLVEGLMPFKKTPVNVLKRGAEYSPVGLVKALSYDIYKVKKGEITASEYIDRLCASLTGTGVVALGMLLKSLGYVVGASDDDKEKEFEELQGVQNYSLVIGEHSYTLDWLAPFALPFFVGVELERLLEDGDGINFRDASKALWSITEPFFEMSMLQGISDAVSVISNAKSGETFGQIASNAAESYFGQAVPTLFGQIARTVDETQRKSYDDKNIDIPQGMQYFMQSQAKKIPGVSQKLEPYVDAWGREKTSDNAFFRAFSNMLSPGYYSKIKSSDMETELKRLHSVAGEEINVFPSAAVKSFKLDDDTEKNLSAKEYTTMQTVQGQTAYKMLTDITKSAAYKKHNDGIKGKIVEKVYELSKANAKKAVAGDKWTGEAWAEDALKQLKDKGVTAAEKCILKLADEWAYEESRESYKDSFEYDAADYSPEELGVIEKVESDQATYYASVEKGVEYNEKTLRHIAVYEEKLSDEMEIEEYAGIRAYAKKTAAMTDGKPSMKKDELKAYLDSTDYSVNVKRALFEAIGNSNWNNPY